ncbi:NAD(P)/FAD-dependent oxidoreductase [Muricoccus radiodurans]|uniref:NAD(P)/FAD-dependent oxidoreductase n=1 Tax=Muricoccus radiodurans TaxID=2231721 RepID=UPI003CEF0F84
MSEAPHRVLVVGGGAAGLDLATRLSRRSRRHGLAVTLVDRAGSYVWKPRLHQVAAGTLDTAEEEVTYLAHARRVGFTYRPGILRALDRAERTVTLGTVQDAQGQDEVTTMLPYDTLVLAIGSHADDFGTPGVLEHAAFIDSRDQADRFYTALRREVIRSLDDPSHRPVSIAVVGAGATGVELSAELHQALELAEGYGLPGLRERLRITLIEAAPRILSALPEKVSAEADRVLRRLGVEVLTNSAVSAVDETGVTLKDGRRIEAALRVWAAGVRAPSVTRGLDGLSTDRAGRLLVEPTLRTRDDPRIFALGDCAALIPEGQQRPLPATAQVAHQEAAHLAGILPGYLAGGTLAPFTYKPRGSLVSLGDYDAFGSLGRLGLFPGGFIEGRLAQWSYAALYRQYQWVIHHWRVPLVWLAGALHRMAKPRVRLE